MCTILLLLFSNSLFDNCGLRYGIHMGCDGHHGAFSLCVHFVIFFPSRAPTPGDILSKLR